MAQLSPQQLSRINGGQPVTNPDGSRWRNGVKVSAQDAAATERTYAENAAHSAQGGANPDRTRDARAEGKLAEKRYLDNPTRYMAQGWDGQVVLPGTAAALDYQWNASTNGFKNQTHGFSATPAFSPHDDTPRYAEGGEVDGPGTGTSDSIPALLSDGEFVIPAREVRRIGVPALDAAFGTDSSTPKQGHFAGGALARAGDGLPVAPNPDDLVAFQGALAALRVAEKQFPDRYTKQKLDAMAATPAGRSRLMIEASTVLPKLQAQQQLGDQQTHVNQLADSRKALATQIRDLDAAMPKVELMDPRKPDDKETIAARAVTMANGGDPNAYVGSATAALNYERQIAHEGVNKDAILRLKQLQAEQQKTDGYINEFAKQGIVAKAAAAPIDPLAAVTGKPAAAAPVADVTSTVAERRSLAGAHINAGTERSALIASGAVQPRQLGAGYAERPDNVMPAGSIGIQHKDGSYTVTTKEGATRKFGNEAEARAAYDPKQLYADANSKNVIPQDVQDRRNAEGDARDKAIADKEMAQQQLYANSTIPQDVIDRMNADGDARDLAINTPSPIGLPVGTQVQGPSKVGLGIMGGEFDEQIKSAPSQLVRTLAGGSSGVQPGYIHPIRADTRGEVLNFGEGNAAPVVRGESSFEMPQVSTGTPRRQLYRSESQRKLMSP